MIMSNSKTYPYTRPGMYLATYEQRLDAGSLCLNFLIGLFSSAEELPNHIDIASAGSIFTISAFSTKPMFTDAQLDTLSAVFDVAQHDKRIVANTYSGIEFLRPIVWFTEYCLIQVTAGVRTYQQAFHRGYAHSDEEQNHLKHVAINEIGFCFTLPDDVFEQITLERDNLEKAITTWQERDFIKLIPDEVERPHIQLNWCEQARHHYSLRIKINSNQ
jgi:hypothetical protein